MREFSSLYLRLFWHCVSRNATA